MKKVLFVALGLIAVAAALYVALIDLPKATLHKTVTPPMSADCSKPQPKNGPINLDCTHPEISKGACSTPNIDQSLIEPCSDGVTTHEVSLTDIGRRSRDLILLGVLCSIILLSGGLIAHEFRTKPQR